MTYLIGWPPLGQHTCTVCKRQGYWTSAWQWYGSIRDLENTGIIVKTCSDECRESITDPEVLLASLKPKPARKKTRKVKRARPSLAEELIARLRHQAHCLPSECEADSQLMYEAADLIESLTL